MLMCGRGPVGDRLRHRIGLRPDDVRAQPPAVSLQRQRDAPGDADEILGLEAGSNGVALRLHTLAQRLAVTTGLTIDAMERRSGRDAFGRVAWRTAGVAVPQVQPQRSVAAQHPPYLAEDLDHGRDVLLGRGLEAELGVHPASSA